MATKKKEDEKGTQGPEDDETEVAPPVERSSQETVPGGRFKVGGKTVNANGEPVK